MTTRLPQTNATLLEIAGGGTSEKYTVAAGTPTTKWEGEEGAYVRRKIRSNFNESTDRLVRVQETTLIVASDLEPPVTIDAGDTIKFKQWDPVREEFTNYTAKAQSLESPMDLPSLPNYQKIALEDVLAT